jgi:hypothetical protein
MMVRANSIFIYLFHEILGRWLHNAATIFLGWTVDLWGASGHVVVACALVGVQVQSCWWLYQRRIFFKL